MQWFAGQYMVRHHLDVVKRAAEHRIAINTHEPVKDTGLRRTWPNWVSREGARGQEFNAKSEEHTSELQSLMRSSYAVLCLKKKKPHHYNRVSTANTLRPSPAEHKQ